MAILVTTKRFIVTPEFEEMSLNKGSNGEHLLSLLTRVRNKNEFVEAINAFHGERIGSATLPICSAKPMRRIEFRRSSYYLQWFSDFLFFLNVGSRTIIFIDMDKKHYELRPLEIMVFYLGHFYLFSYANI